MSDSGKKKGSKKAVAKKRTKDPNAPKRAQTAWIFYMNDKRDQVKKENPDIAFGEVAKKVSALWSAASASEKSKYEKLAEKDKARYLKENADYKARGGGGDGPAKKKAKPAKKAEPESESGSDQGSDEE